MEKLIVMGTRDVKEIKKQIKENFGCSLDLKGAFFVSPKKRVYYAEKTVGDVDWTKLKVNSIGMYFANISKGIRLSIEGAQLIGPKATKGVVEVTDEEASEWMQGLDIIREEEGDFVLIKHGTDFLGSGKVVEGKILNYVPKNRRVLVK